MKGYKAALHRQPRGRSLSALATILSLVAVSLPASASPQLSVLVDFPGAQWLRSLTAAPDGSFYGAGGTLGQGYGAIYHLTPPSAGGSVWKQTNIFDFVSEKTGGGPISVILDPAGNLFGLSAGVPGADINGSVFELSPPAPGQTKWTFALIHSFNHRDEGAYPAGTLARDDAGNLYGAAPSGGLHNCGLIFEFSPPPKSGSPWTETILHDFTCGDDGGGPEGGVILDTAGNLYGTGGDLVFRLAPPSRSGGAWRETVLHRFAAGEPWSYPDTDLVMDGAGNLYGSATDEGGAGFEISPPVAGHTVWGMKQLPIGAQAAFGLDGAGCLYATEYGDGTYNQGVVYKLFPPGTNGHTIWTYKALHNFTGGHDGGSPEGALFVDGTGDVFGTTARGSKNDNGSLYKITQ